MQNSKHKQAFTLIEILISVSILVALVAISATLVNPKSMMDKTRDATLKNSMVKFAAGLELFKLNYGHYPDPGDADDVANLSNYINANSFTYNSIEDPGFGFFYLEIQTTAGLNTGETGNDSLFYQINTNTLPVNEACLQAKSNEIDTEYLFWVPGEEVLMSSATIDECSPELSVVAAN